MINNFFERPHHMILGYGYKRIIPEQSRYVHLKKSETLAKIFVRVRFGGVSNPNSMKVIKVWKPDFFRRGLFLFNDIMICSISR